MTTAVAFERLSVRSFRNIASVEVTPAPRVNVIAGDNGQGKTSLLEALYFVATSRSFRADRLREMIREGNDTGVVVAELVEDGIRREQRGVIGPQGRSVSIDGKRPERLSAYATRTPVVVFHPGDLALTGGGASHRRTLLDRVALFVDPASADHRLRYVKAMRGRQAALDLRGPDAHDLDAFEQLMATHGAALTSARRESAERLSEALLPAFSTMADPKLELSVQYAPGGSTDRDEALSELSVRRDADRRRKGATFGPHRDDLELAIDRRSARRHASQGQQRILTLAIKAAELQCVRNARGAHPVLLLDDVSSELDPTRTGAVYDFLRETPSQVFVTTTRPDLFVTPAIGPDERADWTLSEGALV